MYIITISSEDELRDVWKDPNISFMSFTYNEQSLDQCVQIGFEEYEATYDSLLIVEPMTFTHYNVETGTTATTTLAPGEYGIKPNSRRA